MRKFILKFLIKKYFQKVVTLDIGAALTPTFEFSLLSNKSIRVDGRENSIELSKDDEEDITFISDTEHENFYELKKATCSSLLKPNYAFLAQYPNLERFNIEKITKVKTKKLSDIIKENPLLRGIKIDVQGAELKVLKSAEQYIKQIDFFEIETSFRPMYIDGATFSDVYKFMSDNNFYLLDIRKQYWSNSRLSVSGDLIWCDCLFVRNDISKETDEIMSLVYGYLHRIEVGNKKRGITFRFWFNILKFTILFNNLFNRNYVFTSPLSNCSEKKLGF